MKQVIKKYDAPFSAGKFLSFFSPIKLFIHDLALDLGIHFMKNKITMNDIINALIMFLEAPARPSGDEIPQETTSSAEESSSAGIQSETNDQNEAENVDQPASSSDAPTDNAISAEDREKEIEKEDDFENTEARRPSSRESVTSTASSSSERTLIIRSASEVNKIVADSSDVVVKTEKVMPDRPAISILNPDQLGVTSGGGENFLNSTYGQPADPMMGYLPTSLQDGAPLQVSHLMSVRLLARCVSFFPALIARVFFTCFCSVMYAKRRLLMV